MPINNRNNIKICVAEPGNATKIAEIEQKTSNAPWSYDALLKDIAENPNSIVIVAKNDEEIVGYADIWKVFDEIQLNNIAVEEEYRGNHIASEMLDVLADVGRELECKTMNLEVRKSNLPARKLYEKAGFQEVGIREHYYIDNDEDAILMDLML